MINFNLKEWIGRNRVSIENEACSVVCNAGIDSISVDIDGSDYVGTITCWSNSICEIQFNRISDGAVILLETIRDDHCKKIMDALRVVGIKVDG